MNKKGQAEFVLLLLFLLLIGSLAYGVSNASNPYESYKRDCNKLYENNFTINDTCWSNETDIPNLLNNNITYVPCTKRDYDSLNKFCFEQYKRSN